MRDAQTVNLSRAMQVVKHFEGLHTHSYICPSGVVTVGWGSTRLLDGRPISLGYTCTVEEAERLLERDLREAAAAVLRLTKVPLEEHQLNALTCFVHNVGQGNYAASTLLKLLNQGQYDAVPEQLLRWVKGAGGQTLPGLVRRRKCEAHLYSTGRVRFHN